MTRLHHSLACNVAVRRGFTLLELLVVLAILVLLTAMIVPAVMRSQVTATGRATEATLSKVDQGADHQVDEIVKGAGKERQQRSREFQGLLTFAGGNEDRAQALLTYCRIKQAFPQTAAEVTSPGFTLGGVNFPRPVAFAPLAGIDPTTNDPNHVSAALLHIALTKRAIQGYTFPAEDVIGNAEGDITLNAPNGGTIPVRVFEDGWNRPLGFQRWYTSPQLNQPPFVNPKDYSKDRFDPRGTLVDPAWANNRAFAERVLGVTFSLDNKRLVVYSAGQNERYENLGGDDILSFRLRVIGERGGAKQP